VSADLSANFQRGCVVFPDDHHRELVGASWSSGAI
jgi:hypothetical protein